MSSVLTEILENVKMSKFLHDAAADDNTLTFSTTTAELNNHLTGAPLLSTEPISYNICKSGCHPRQSLAVSAQRTANDIVSFTVICTVFDQILGQQLLCIIPDKWASQESYLMSPCKFGMPQMLMY